MFLKCHHRDIEILFLYLIHCIERQHHNYCLMLKTSITKNGEVVFLKCHYRGIEISFLYLIHCIEHQHHNYCLMLKTSITKNEEVVLLKCHYRGIEILFLYLFPCIERHCHEKVLTCRKLFVAEYLYLCTFLLIFLVSVSHVTSVFFTVKVQLLFLL